MEKIKIYLVEYFNENNNCWEWGNIVRQSEYTKEQAQKETLADNFSLNYDKDKDTLEGEKEDVDYVLNNWEDNTRAWDITV